MKKTISLILCLAMIVSTFSFALPVYAADAELSDIGAPATVTFVGDVNLPEDITRLDGSVVDFTNSDLVDDYLKNIKPLDDTPGLRFQGWSTTGEYKDIVTSVTLTSEEVTTLYAVVDHSINFYPYYLNNTTFNGWWGQYFSRRTMRPDGGYQFTPGGGNDRMWCTNFDTKIPAEAYNAIRVYVDNALLEYPEIGQGYGKIYFGAQAESRSFTGTVADKFIDAMGRDIAVIEFAASKHSQWTGNITGIRLDHTAGCGEFAIYGYELVKAPYSDPIEFDIQTVTPTTGYPKDYSASTNVGVVQSVSWEPVNDYDDFYGKTVYTVTVTLAPDAAYDKFFNLESTATVNGFPADIYINPYNSVATITYTFPETDEYYSYEIEVAGPEVIDVAARAAQYNVKFVSQEGIPNQKVKWYVRNDTGMATITDDGKLVPVADGIVYVYAQSLYDFEIFTPEFPVSIVNQAEPGTITYYSGTTDEVTNMPEPLVDVEGLVQLSRQIPEREGYLFLGWSVGEESIKEVTEVNVLGDVDVYAIWGKGHVAQFDNTNHGGSPDSGTFQNHADYLIVKPTADKGETKLSFWGTFAGLGLIDTATHTTFRMRIAIDNISSAYLHFYHSGVSYNMSEGNTFKQNTVGMMAKGLPDEGDMESDKWVIVEVDLSSNTAWLNQGQSKAAMFCMLRNAVGVEKAYLDYAAFLNNYRNITFVSDIPEAVIPDDMTVKLGDKILLDEATAEGYEFVGWSTTPGDKENAKKSVFVRDDITLYAVFNETVDVENAVDGNTVYNNVGNLNEALLVKTNAKAGVNVTLTYEGAEEPITVKTNANGYAIFDLTGEDVTDVQISMDSDYEFVTIIKTSFADAENKANELIDTTRPGGGEVTNPNANKVTDLTTTGTIIPTASKPGAPAPGMKEGEVSEDASPKDKSRQEGDILFNFNVDADKDFFSWYRQSALDYKEGIAKITWLGRGSSDGVSFNTTSSLEIDAETHKYMIVYAKQESMTDPTLRMYFRTDTAGLAEARTQNQKVGEDYSMIIYDWSNHADWKGKIKEFMFSCIGDTKGTMYMDWVLFTNTIPEDPSAIGGGAPSKVGKFDTVNAEAPAFADIADDAWYKPEVEKAYKLGLVSGLSDTAYGPDGEVTVAQAIAFAIKLNYAYLGRNANALRKLTVANWYDPYVTAAAKVGIVNQYQYQGQYDRPATRKEVADMIYKAIPETWYAKMNMFTNIPDLNPEDPTTENIYALYNAGILTGSDDAYSFLPETPITRAEVAAIVNRAAIKDNRKRIVTPEELEARKKHYTGEQVSKINADNCEGGKFKLGEDGIAWAKSANTDPQFYPHSVTGTLKAGQVSKIKIGIKVEDKSKITTGSQFFFIVEGSGWSEANSIKIPRSADVDKGDGVFEVVIDVPSHQVAATKDITAWRFDPFDLSGIDFGIVYIDIE